MVTIPSLILRPFQRRYTPDHARRAWIKSSHHVSVRMQLSPRGIRGEFTNSGLLESKLTLIGSRRVLHDLFGLVRIRGLELSLSGRTQSYRDLKSFSNQRTMSASFECPCKTQCCSLKPLVLCHTSLRSLSSKLYRQPGWKTPSMKSSFGPRTSGSPPLVDKCQRDSGKHRDTECVVGRDRQSAGSLNRGGFPVHARHVP